MTINGNLTVATGGALAVDVSNSNTYDQVLVNGDQGVRLGGVRLVGTALFTDLRGSTELYDPATGKFRTVGALSATAGIQGLTFGNLEITNASTNVTLLVNNSGLLNDSDTYWQIAVGQSILDHGALPRVDVYSFTKPGEAWLSSSWLAQILYAVSYNLAGWTGPVVVAAGAIAATFGLLAHFLERRLPSTYAALVALAATLTATAETKSCSVQWRSMTTARPLAPSLTAFGSRNQASSAAVSLVSQLQPAKHSCVGAAKCVRFGAAGLVAP